MIVEPAPAKLNLALHVRRRRADGYHDIETLFAFCTDGDIVTIAIADMDAFAIDGPFASALGGAEHSENLVTRAASAFRATFAVVARHRITLTKNLPVASGIGGGSADAAAMLRALAKLHGIAPDERRLVAIAATLGADVPACLAGRAAFGTGRGDALTEVTSIAGTPALLVNPGVAVSTAAVFAAWDGIDRGPLDPARVADGRNDLEAPARRLAPVIGEVLAALSAQPGAGLVRMSGSGATCFALFRDIASRDAAADALTAQHCDWWLLHTSLA